MKKKIPLTFESYSKKDQQSIKKIKLILKKDCILDSSVSQLCDYYYGKFKIELTKKQKKTILQLAKIKHEQNKIEAEDWARCGVFYLAYEQLTREKKASKIVKNSENWFYQGDITEVMKYAGKIVSNSFERNRTENQIGNNLRHYCKEIKDEYQRIIK